MKNCDLFQSKDGRFTVEYNWEDTMYKVMFNGEKIVYGDWIYTHCIKWLYEHDYITCDDMNEELYGSLND